MFKVLAFLSKREDLSAEAFIDYYETKHITSILSLVPGPTLPGWRRCSSPGTRSGSPRTRRGSSIGRDPGPTSSTRKRVTAG